MKVANFFPSDFPSTTQSKRACVRARACTAPFQRMAEFRPSRAEPSRGSIPSLRLERRALFTYQRCVYELIR